MRRKKLLTVGMCMALVMASCTVSGASGSKDKKSVQTEAAAETMALTAEGGSDGQDGASGNSKSATESSESGSGGSGSSSEGGSGSSSGGSGSGSEGGSGSGSEGGSGGSGSGSEGGSGSSSGGSGSGSEGGSGSGSEGGSGGSGSGSESGSGGSEGGSGSSSDGSGSGSEGGSGGSEGGSGSGSEGSGSGSESGSGSGSEGGSESSSGGLESGSGDSNSGSGQGSAETPESPTEGSGESETLPTETTPGTEAQTESETEADTEIQEEETESEHNSPYSTNEELIAHQQIVVPPDIQLEFRFTQVDKRIAIVSDRDGAGVYESKSEDARMVGELEYYGCCYILDDQGDGWYYVESGNVRGFVKSEALVIDEVARRIEKIKGNDQLPAARLLVARTENEAFDYTHTTVCEVMAEPVYALASGDINIYEQRKESSRVTGSLADQALCYILADSDKDWVFVESGDARGFVQASQLVTGSKAEKKVEDTGENNMPLASVRIEPKDNKACYYTLTSVREASQSAKTREAMVNFALQFVGNPYVWGGTSLTNGADCSGFVQSVYAYFGYSLPRVAENQAVYGMQIPIESAEPGDLIFYAKNGYVYHVSMYIGNGQVVHASNSRSGIITSGISGNAVWATRIISD